MTWDEWRGSLDGRPVFWTKHLLCAFGCHVDLHKMVSPDDAGCFHTHPAYAVRIILWGGYVEHLHGESALRHRALWRFWRPGMIGVVEPSMGHRIDELLNDRVSYSLWIRLRKVAEVKLLGDGWPEDLRAREFPH